MASIHQNIDLSGRTVAAIANLLVKHIQQRDADLKNPALGKVLAFRDAGLDAIMAAKQPIAFVRKEAQWFLREGNHRALALCMLGYESIEGMDLSSAKQVAA